MTSICRYEYNNQGIIIKVGLWKYCIIDPNLGSQCSAIAYPNSGFDPEGFYIKTRVAQAFITLACIMSGLSVISVLSTVEIDNHKRKILLIGRILAVISLITGIIGVAVGMNIITDTPLETHLGWGASVIIGIVAIIINFCGAITSFLIKLQPLIDSVPLEG